MGGQESVRLLVGMSVRHTLLHTTTLKVCWKVSSAASDVARREDSTRSELTSIFSCVHATICHYDGWSVSPSIGWSDHPSHTLTYLNPKGVLEGVVSCFAM